MEYTLILFSIHPEELPVIQSGLGDIPITYFDGTGYSSYSKVVNAAIESAPTEVVILMTDKVRPRPEHVYKTLDLINQGYGFVGLHEFRFFGFKKQLFRQIGLFDEGYLTGGYEDDDLKNRMIEHDIAFYLTTECPAIVRPSHCNYAGSKPYFDSKWHYQHYPHTDIVQYITRLKPEPIYDTASLGPSIETRFLAHKTHSIACTDKVFPIMESTVITQVSDFRTFVISENINDFFRIKQMLGQSTDIEYFDCSKYISYSQTINTCVEQSPNDKIIIILGSVSPSSKDISEIKNYINRGIGIAAVCEFKCFGVNREVFKQVGSFDERFQGYEYSVYDYVLRCIKQNISLIITHAVVPRFTSKNKIEKIVYSDHKHWESKWEIPETGKVAKLLPEHFHNYKFTSNGSTEILNCAQHSYTNLTKFGKFFHKVLSQ